MSKLLAFFDRLGRSRAIYYFKTNGYYDLAERLENSD